MEKLIVDRIEEGVAVLEKEDKSHLNVSLDTIAIPVKEGTVLLFDGNSYTADEQEEAERRSRMLALQKKLMHKN